MRRNKYEIGHIKNHLTVLSVLPSERAPSGVCKRYLLVRCDICNKEKRMSTQTIDNAKSCGCERYKRTYKPIGSGKRSPIGTIVEINTIISIYKSNAKKRNLVFNLSYKEMEMLVLSNCFFCGDKGDNVLRKKGYADFNYCGVDRVNNNIGYEVDNCVSCCQWCNEAKNNNAIDVFIDKCKKVSCRIEKDDNYYQIAKNRIDSHIIIR